MSTLFQWHVSSFNEEGRGRGRHYINLDLTVPRSIGTQEYGYSHIFTQQLATALLNGSALRWDRTRVRCVAADRLNHLAILGPWPSCNFGTFRPENIMVYEIETFFTDVSEKYTIRKNLEKQNAWEPYFCSKINILETTSFWKLVYAGKFCQAVIKWLRTQVRRKKKMLSRIRACAHTHGLKFSGIRHCGHTYNWPKNARTCVAILLCNFLPK